MKLALAVHHIPPKYVAGVELVTWRSARWLAARQHSVEIACVETVDAPAPLTIDTSSQGGITVYRLGLSLQGGHLPLSFRYQDDRLGSWYREHLEKVQPDLVHVQSCYLLTGSIIEAAKSVGVPVVVSLHDYWFLCPRLTLLRPNGQRCPDGADPATCAWCLMLQRRRFRIVDRVMMTLRGRSAADRFARLIAQLLCHRLTANMRQRQTYLESVLRNADRIVSPGRLSLDILARRGLPTRNMRLVPNGLNFDAWQFAPRSPFTGGLRIGYVGQLAPHKGVHLLIEAFEQLASDPGLHELKIYGDPSRDPSYSRQLLNLARGNPKIRFCGTYDNGQVETVMSGIDVLVVPSTWFEPAPMVIMEAQAAKVPVVASRLPNMQSAVRDGVDGLLFESGNVTDLARQLRRLAQEPGLLHQLSLGIGAVRSAIDEMCEIESIYRSVLAERSRCPGFSPAGTSG